MTVVIRTARLADASHISRLTAQLGYDVQASVVTARLAKLLARADQRIFVADVDERPVGWLHAAMSESIEVEPYVTIVGLVVDRSHRGRGIGRRLLEVAERWAGDGRCRVVRLRSSIGRTAAHQFYERAGYTNIKTQYSFVKSLDGDNSSFSAFVPVIDTDSP